MSYNIDKSKLLNLRNKQFWKQEDLALASSLSVRTVQRVESQGTCSQETLKALAAAFNLPADVLTVRTLNRIWMLGPAIGMLGGTIGCVAAYVGVFKEASLTGQPFSDYLGVLVFVSIMLAFTTLFPAYVLYRNWNLNYDRETDVLVSLHKA